MKYKVIVGVNYKVNGKNKRVEPGEMSTDIPEESVKWLVEQGVIEPVVTPATKAPVAPVKE